MDSRITRLAEILVDYSVKVRRNDHVRIRVADEGLPLGKEVLRLCLQRGALVRTEITDSEMDTVFYRHATKHQIEARPKLEMAEAKWMDCSIGIYGERNTKHLSGVDSQRIAQRMKVLRPVRDHVVEKVRWVICNYPSDGLAQDADMSLDEYADFVFDATNIDWAAMSKKQDKLKRVLDAGKDVLIKGPGTELRFSIRGRKAIKCDGHRNMPDGEVFMGPDEMTAEGHILFDFPAIYRGKEVDGVRLEFDKGLCVKATAAKNEKFLNSMLDTDAGARRIGEFGVGVNFGIQRFTRDILFDEKIGGTIHLALGSAYKEGGGKNVSAIHWDMIKDLRKDGEVRVDGKLIEKNGRLLV